MEEILASIRRIISEDEAGEEEEPRLPGVDRRAQEEILDLTDRVDEPEPPEERREQDEVEESPPDAFPGEKEEPGPPGAQAEGLLSDHAAAAAVAALARAEELLDDPPASDRPLRSLEGQTLDALVRAALIPLLKAWLDENLPSLVERIVREEVRRLADQSRGR